MEMTAVVWVNLYIKSTFLFGPVLFSVGR